MKTTSDRIDAVAAHWLARLMSPACTQRDHDAFEAWCAQDAAHAAAFAQVAQLHAAASALGDDAWMRAAARSARRSSAARTRHRTGLRAAGWLAAAALMLAVATFAWRLSGDRGEALRYATAVGEQRHVELDDGTRLQLDTDTALSIRFDASSRELVLDHGRIQISVGADARRPFVVRSGRSVVRDIGTEFQVARLRGEVSVMLLSGAVNVALAGKEGAGRDLVPGEAVQVGDTGELGLPARIDVDATTSWTRGLLTFKDRPLGDLLEEMNRYSSTKLHVADPRLATLTVSGVFRVGDQASLLQALKTAWSISARRVSEHEIALSSAR